MKKLIIMLLSLALAGCSWFPYRQNVEQGNIVTADMTSELRIGMTPQQVRYIMGNPVLGHSFDINRWDYIYTFRRGTNPADVERIALEFENGHLKHIGPLEKYKIES